MDEIEIPTTLTDEAEAPTYATEFSAGLDLRTVEEFELAPLQRRLVPTGLRMAIPTGYEGQVRPRSGLAMKHGISVVNAPGTIDSDYRGEICVLLINLGESVVQVSKGERIAQLVVAPVVRARIVQVGSLDDTTRGSGGFGSTGTN